MKITEINDMIDNTILEGHFSKDPEALKIKKAIENLSIEDNRMALDVIDDLLKPNKEGVTQGYVDFIAYARENYFPLKEIYENAVKYNFVASELAFQTLINDVKNNGLQVAYVNILEDYIAKTQKSQPSPAKSTVSGGMINVQDVPLTEDKKLKRSFDVMKFLLSKIEDKKKEKRQSIEPTMGR